MDPILERINSASCLNELIKESLDLDNTCDADPAAILKHTSCFDTTQKGEGHITIAYCPQGLLNLLIECIIVKPNYIDDNVKESISEYFKRRNVKVVGLLNKEILDKLHARSSSRVMTWLKFESIIKRLIKDYTYPPKVMADEVLRTVKHELEPALAADLASILSACVGTCREVNRKHASGEEEEEKWCEIIDWMSWFLSHNDSGNLDCF